MVDDIGGDGAPGPGEHAAHRDDSAEEVTARDECLVPEVGFGRRLEARNATREMQSLAERTSFGRGRRQPGLIRSVRGNEPDHGGEVHRSEQLHRVHVGLPDPEPEVEHTGRVLGTDAASHADDLPPHDPVAPMDIDPGEERGRRA